jgi:prepilin-type N-terminal cleavage/methylation domain-containing protein/prepilin-type processing-associated H-X9-DG protein
MMRRKGFTVLELLVVIGVVVILAVILYPVLAPHHHPSAGRAACQSNLKQIALGFKQYIQDYHEKYPIAKNSGSGLGKSDNWIGEIMPYMKSEQVFLCPSEKEARNGQSSYGYNARMSKVNEQKIDNPAIVVLNYEVTADANGWTQTGTEPQNVSASTRHLDGANYSFVDGHVKWLRPAKMTDAKPSENNFTFAVK